MYELKIFSKEQVKKIDRNKLLKEIGKLSLFLSREKGLTEDETRTVITNAINLGCVHRDLESE